jgi:hypothetical protein
MKSISSLFKPAQGSKAMNNGFYRIFLIKKAAPLTYMRILLKAKLPKTA